MEYNKNGVKIKGRPDEDLIYERPEVLSHPEVIGKRFGRLTIIDEIRHPLLTGNIYLLCQCDCGNWYINSYSDITKGRVKSCGCQRIENIKKGKKKNRKSKAHHKLRNIRKHMIQRCYYKNTSNYSNYGGRGITVCDEWRDKKNGLKRFEEWALANGYKEGLSIDRIDVNGNYEPSNCRWITMAEQAKNKRNNVIFYDKNGNRYVLSELARIHNCTRDTIIRKVASGELPYICNNVEEKLNELLIRSKRSDDKRREKIANKDPMEYQNHDYFIINGKYLRATDLAKQYNCKPDAVFIKAYRGEIKYDDITFDLEAKYNHMMHLRRSWKLKESRMNSIKSRIRNQYEEFGINLNNDELNKIYNENPSDNWSPSIYESEYESEFDDEDIN